MLHPQEHHPIDYCLLFNSTLADYYAATSDRETAADLWPVALQQVQHAIPQINKDGLFELATTWWVFIDWNDQLDKATALQGIVTYCLQETYNLAKQLGREDEVPHLPALIAKMKAASRRFLFDKKQQLFVSGKEGQVSTASQVWMVLSKTVSVQEAKKIMAVLENTKGVVKPVSP
jgi:cellobiose phosphorylase